MNHSIPSSYLQLQSLIRRSGELEVSLASLPVPALAADEVLVRMQAAPINPSDLGMLFGPADLSTLQRSGTPERPVLTARVPERTLPGLAGRLDQALPVGNEGAGLVVAAGSSEAAQRLLGRTVAILGGAMYAQYRSIAAAQCLALPEGTTAREGASAFVNPLTALGMVETMRREGHRALVHTAAASNLGQMLHRICAEEGVGLVNVVRSPEQEALLRGMGAVHVCNSAAPDFAAQLTEACAATGATIAFDATGGGKLAGQILSSMEAALNRSATTYNRYGSSTHKQVYIYGMLDTGPTEFARNFGMTWGIGGWLLFGFLKQIGPEAGERLKQRVANGLKTTFASQYAQEISLADALRPDLAAVYSKRATGAKFLIDPSR